MSVTLTKVMYFEAAHFNPNGDDRTRRMHGHSYKVELVVAGEVRSPFGWLIDYADIKKAFQPLYDRLDHQLLNEVEGLSDPTLPGLRRWLEEQLAGAIEGLSEVRLSIVGDLVFRPVQLAADDAAGLPRRWQFTLEAAQYLPQLPREHKCLRLHGHSYRVQVGAGDLERLLPHLHAIYDRLDHTCLNDIPGLEQATCERICQWLWAELERNVDDLQVIVVKETDTASCTYLGDRTRG